MFILFILLWLISLIILVNNPKNASHRWFAAVTFLSGCGGLANVLDVYIISGLAADSQHTLKYVSGFFNSLSHYFAPYAFFMFSVSYSGLFETKWRRLRNILSIGCPIPFLVLYAFFPLNKSFNPDSPDTGLAAILTVTGFLCALTSYYFLIRSLIKEQNPKIRKERRLIAIMVIPATGVIFFTSYALTALGVKDSWKYNILVILYLFVVFILFAAKYSVMGFKLRFERYRLGIRIKTMASGTEILNNVIRNEMARIAVSSDNLKASGSSAGSNSQDSNVAYDLETISNSTRLMLDMIKKIQKLSKDVTLIESVADVADIIENSLNDAVSLPESQNANISKQLSYSAKLLCDTSHVREAIGSILKNAFEAVKPKGDIFILTENSKKWFSIIIKDTGTGISKADLPHIMEPYYTTSDRKQNFGLGLTYCYNVMQKHGGTLVVESEENNGTAVFLNFPKRRVLEVLSVTAPSSKVQQ